MSAGVPPGTAPGPLPEARAAAITTTGIAVNPGDTIEMTASGTAYGGGGYPTVGPTGLAGTPVSDGAFPDADPPANLFGLAGSIDAEGDLLSGDGDEWFAVGSSLTTVADRAGTLRLVFVDALYRGDASSGDPWTDAYGDNAGGFDVEITVTPSVFGPEPFANAGSLISPRGAIEVGGPDGQRPAEPPVEPVSDVAPTVKITTSPKKPQASVPVKLSAARSDDPDGAITAFEWDLDDDGVFDDAVGKRVETAFSLPGQVRVGAQVYDDGGRVTIGDKSIRVARGRAPTLEPPKELVEGQRTARPGELDLESGYAGWDPSGKAFGKQPATGGIVSADRVLNVGGAIGGDYADVAVPNGEDGGAYASSFKTKTGTDLTVEAAGNLAVGRLASPRVALTSTRHVSFLLGGDGDGGAGQASKTRVEVWASKPGGKPKQFPQLSVAAPEGGGTLNEVNIDVGALQDQGYTGVILVAVDDSPGGHVQLGGLSTNPPPLAQVTPQPSGIDEIDVPRRFPVSGFADPHVHVMAHQGFGGLRGVRTYMGVPGGAFDEYTLNPSRYQEDVGRDHKGHFGGLTAAFFLDVLEGRKSTPSGLVDVLAGLATAGAGHSDGKPGPAHQMTHVTHLYRAWQGGQRLISSLAVTNAGAETLTAEANPVLPRPRTPRIST